MSQTHCQDFLSQITSPELSFACHPWARPRSPGHVRMGALHSSQLVILSRSQPLLFPMDVAHTQASDQRAGLRTTLWVLVPLRDVPLWSLPDSRLFWELSPHWAKPIELSSMSDWASSLLEASEPSQSTGCTSPQDVRNQVVLALYCWARSEKWVKERYTPELQTAFLLSCPHP